MQSTFVSLEVPQAESIAIDMDSTAADSVSIEFTSALVSEDSSSGGAEDAAQTYSHFSPDRLEYAHNDALAADVTRYLTFVGAFPASGTYKLTPRLRGPSIDEYAVYVTLTLTLTLTRTLTLTTKTVTLTLTLTRTRTLTFPGTLMESFYPKAKAGYTKLWIRTTRCHLPPECQHSSLRTAPALTCDSTPPPTLLRLS